MRRAVLLLILLAGCARQVVLDPADVERLDEKRWTVLSEPGAVVLVPADASTTD